MQNKTNQTQKSKVYQVDALFLFLSFDAVLDSQVGVELMSPPKLY